MSVAGNGAPALGATEDDSRQTQPELAVMDGLSSSKVTVEYHDPSGVFSLIQGDLASRLPLRNLHWKAPTRPLRSIDSLHVDLVPSKDSAHISRSSSSTLAPPQGTQGTPTRTTEEILRPPAKEKERRHQIPGLRQTPYLKVYLLRCDDSETYKATARKQVREWVKEHTPPSQSSTSSTQENHDAYEWMIVHVVIPDTHAASQPRGSSSSTTGEKEKSGSTSRWTRGTTTLLEKLRADFNISSKSAPDRVAQIRLPKERVPPHMLPSPAPVTSPPITESPQEQERAWTDVIVKFKNLILLSFDLRVSQYEEDIRKNDAQRSFPGWNFNTFFILKEGLARGFESVGLVEDALLGYDELSIGLDTVIRDQANDGSGTQGGVLLSYSEDLHEKATEILKRSEQADGDHEASQPPFHDVKPINAQNKDYRGLILANNISVFDFRLYIFARQMFLLLRLGNSVSARSDLAAKLQPRPSAGTPQKSVDDSSVGMKSGSSANDSEDLFSLAELCSRALNFVTFAGRLLRDDLINGAKSHDVTFSDHIVDNIVRSWTFSALEQVLRETSTTSLPFTRFSKDLSTGSSGKSLSFGGRNKEQKTSVNEPKSMIHPSRSSSLNHGRPAADMPYAQPTPSGQVVFENGQYQDRPTPNQESVLPSAKNGLQDLAGSRAQLLVVQRRLLEHIGKGLGWSIGWAAILPSLNQKEDLTEIDLDENEETTAETDSPGAELETKPTAPRAGVSAGVLINAVSSVEQFRQFYENLSDLVVKHYMAAGQTKSAESVLGDLAALRFELGDFAAAAMYFGRMASLFAESRWNTVETTMLKMYSRCLKKLNRKDEYVRTLLDLLAKSAASRMSFRASSKRASNSEIADMPPGWLNDDKVDTTGAFQELVDYSQQLPYDVTVQMLKYFGDISVEPYVRHFDDKDGFQLRLQFRHLLEDEIEIRATKVRLVSAGSTQGKEIWLENQEPTQLKKGMNRVWVGCQVNTTGPYVVDKIILEAKRILFVHEPVTKSESTTPLGIITSVSTQSLKAAKKSRILCFPRAESFQARIYLSHFIHIDKPRHVEVECSSGWNHIKRAEIRLKSASAGLRLRTANTSVAAGDVEVEDKPTPGVIAIGPLGANSTATLKVPYDMETILQDLTVKVEVDYFTEDGQFQYISSFTIPVELPLDVNVHDHFKNQSLFSKFNIKTASYVPLELLDVELQGSDEFNVHAPKRSTEAVHVFPKQPVAITYKITKKAIDISKKRQSRQPSTGSLSLAVEYRCLNEDVLDRVRKLFADTVANSPVHRLGRLLTDTFALRLEHEILPHQVERIALLEKLDLGAFEDMGWRETLDSLPHIIRDDTELWLQKWHEQHRTILLSKESSSETALSTTAPPSPYPPRRMVITVSVPQTHILHTASLSFSSLSLKSTLSTVAIVGQPLMTTLRISHTRRWVAPASLISAANLSAASDPIDFVYTIEANPETWLIAGQRRAHFSANEDEQLEWPIVLIPLKPGNALLPNVEIRARIKPKDSGKGGAAGTSGSSSEAAVLNCETDYLSYGDSVIVVPDVRSSTVGIGDMAMGSPRSVVWLESMGQ
ncbi:trafficking protein particle complex subunit 10 [Pyrenochaeta sp. MPI-SDFR-AT-0127]|nr:trafficking protein particle complex subunit 10 [Pyrenochaeta sp. MPI-SDFR-AT-0127]